MAHDAYVVYDPDGRIDLAAIAPDRVEADRCALRVEPTPSTATGQLARDLLGALGRRPTLAFRFSDGGLDDERAAGLWCHAHGILDLVIPRAHTLDVKRVGEVAMLTSQQMSYDELLTWWFIDGSADRSLERNAEALRATRACPDQMREQIAARQNDHDRMRAHPIELREATAHHAVRDAHPAVFASCLAHALPSRERDVARSRFSGAREVMRSAGAFRSWQSALWYGLRCARDPADALIILRAAQLAMLERRIHLTMRSGPWQAAQAGRAHVADQAPRLVAYVDPLVASIGALALQTGFSARTLTTVTGQHVQSGAVVPLGAFDAGEMDSSIAPLVAAQVRAADRHRSPQPLLVRVRGARDTRMSPLTEDRINAVLRTLTTEREIDFDHAAWAEDHGVAMASV